MCIRDSYETDGLSAYKQTPMLVVLPENTVEVSKILSYCNKKKIKVVPTSPKIAGFVRRNKSYKSLLPVGIKL